jgi:RNA-binding protein Musashi
VLEPCKIFVGGLSFNTDEKRLEEIFSVFGQIINIRIVRDQLTGRSKGFAFITFAENESVEKSKELDNQNIDGKYIGVKQAFNKRS